MLLRLAPRGLAARAAAPFGARSKHTSMEVRDQGIAVITLDCEGEKQNTLSEDLTGEFDEMLGRLEADEAIKAAVLISGKKGSWIAGANIKMIEGLTDAPSATKMAGIGQQTMDRIAAIGRKKPIVAAIDGSCLGGGLEVALACTYRIATTSSKTVLGVPEVMIGLLPGSGGTQRLPALVGGPTSLDMMLTGKQLKAERAKKMGLVDLVVDANALERSALSAADQLVGGGLKPRQRKLGWMDWFLEKTPVGRKMMFDQATKKVMKQTKGRYPAPLSILECARVGLESGHSVGSKVERERFGELAVTPEAKALRGLFFGQTECKKNTMAAQVGGQFPKVQTVGVLGAGLMGAGIAEITAAKGMRVLLKDQNVGGLTRGEEAIKKNLGGKLKKRRMTQFAHDSTLAQIVGLTDADAWQRHYRNADLVIEAVFEQLEVKHAVIREMEAVLPKHAIIASNTSTIPIGDIAAAAERPENVVGMHYFSPVPQMPLLEVIPHAGTDPAVTAAAVDVGLRQGKTVIICKDVPGFYVNRCLGPFLSESIAVGQEGADPLKFNQAMLDFGYPVGGLMLGDEVGNDVAQKAMKTLVGDGPGRLGVRMEGGDFGILDEMVEKGLLGKKAGKGYFDHSTGQKPPPLSAEYKELAAKYRSTTKDISGEDINQVFERCFLRFVKEAAHCVEDGVVESPRHADIGAVFGVGFPPFLGGPFMWIDSQGCQAVVDKMERLRQEHGERFAPPQLLIDQAKKGTPFHP